MESYLTIWVCGLALIQAALAGEAGRAVVEQRTQILRDRVKRLGSRCNAPFWTGTRGGVVAVFFIHPAQALQREGGVFTTTSADGKDRFWLLTTYDPGNGRVEYVVMAPAFTANEIKIRVVPYGEQHSRATITYRRSALAPEGNDEVAKLDAHWAERQRSHWETAINEALAKGGIHD